MSSNNNQQQIIQEQKQANERIVRAVEHPQEGVSKNQVPANERIKQLTPNERVQTEPTQPKPPDSE